MNLTLIITPEFARAVKNLLKKYRLLLHDLKTLEQELSTGEAKAVELGRNCYKTRLPNSSIPVGKRGGFRIIYFYKKDNKIYLLDIYAKTEMGNIKDAKLLEILKNNHLK